MKQIYLSPLDSVTTMNDIKSIIKLILRQLRNSALTPFERNKLARAHNELMQIILNRRD